MTKTNSRKETELFDRVASILEEARSNVVRTVNSHMVIANWLIGREIVQEQQGGKKRAGYGDVLLEGLSKKLKKTVWAWVFCYKFERFPPVSSCILREAAGNSPQVVWRIG